MDRNLEKCTREELIEYIEKLKRQNRKRYGLVWEEKIKPEAVVEECETKLPVVKEVAEKAIENAPGEPTNIIIEGDNYHALSVLNYTHAGKIDVIYIDPPYNTGNKDFIYNDCYVDKEDTFRHSKWLSFMEKRLKLAKNLLADDGVIFISIDDNEQAQLKMLCDSIFGENNFISCITVESGEVFGTKAAHVNKTFVKVKDYVLVYSRNKRDDSLAKMPLYDEMRELYDGHFNTVIDESLATMSFFDYLRKTEYAGLFGKYGLSINKHGVNSLMLINDDFRSFIFSDISKKLYADAPYNKNVPVEVLEKVSGLEPFFFQDKLLHRTSSGSVRMYISFFDSLRKSDDYQPKFTRCTYRGDLWKGFHFDMRNIDDEGAVKFNNGKKPVRLIRQLVKWSNKRTAIVLDFFAGSGTTGQAVMELNKEDGGHRQFILVTNNEANGQADAGAEGIAEKVTYPRIKTVITGIRPDGTKYSDGIPANLRYFKTDFVEKGKTTDDTREALITECCDMIRMRENAFEHVASAPEYRFYKNDKVFVPIIFDQFAIAETWELVEKLNTEKLPVHCYNFSYNRHANEEEIPEDTELTWTACSIPETVLEVYRKIFRKKKEV